MGGSRSLLAIFVFTSLMVIDDLDALRRALAPDEADSPLIVDADTELTLPVAAQSLKPVSRTWRTVLRRPGSAASYAPPFQCCRIGGSAGGEKAPRSPWSGRIVSHGKYTTVTVKRNTISGHVDIHLDGEDSPWHRRADASSVKKLQNAV